MDLSQISQGRLVLLVEDDPASREACATVLRRHFCVLTAASFKEAVHKILSISALDAVVTDYHLPDGSGLEVRKLAYLREIPVLLISGDSTLGYNYQPFLAKPFTGEDLMTAVRSISPGLFRSSVLHLVGSSSAKPFWQAATFPERLQEGVPIGTVHNPQPDADLSLFD